MKFQKVLPVVAVVILLYYVCRQVHIKHKHVENLTEDRILSEKERDEIYQYYGSLNRNKPADPSKLSNKAKVFVNTVTENPFTALTDSAISNLRDPNWDTPVEKAAFMAGTIGMILFVLGDYQTTYIKEKITPSRQRFVARLQTLIKKNKNLFAYIELIQFAISDNYPVPESAPGRAPMRKDEEKWVKRMYANSRHGIIQLFGNLVSINLDGSKTINMSGPLQTNAIDLMYAYMYPNQDVFTWLQSLFSGKN